ncbi:MAG: class I SAM-dependent methyltransferase [Acidobacteriota bacterium]
MALSIFGDDQAARQRWVDYWTATVERNRELVLNFNQTVLIDFQDKRILDVGCGSAGLAQLVGKLGGYYVGLDYEAHILRLAARFQPEAPLLRASAAHLPFRSASFDYVFAFDVVEHLTGGLPWQASFMRELRRVLRPLGMIFLTTPNRYYPREGHTLLLGPQYLPIRLADWYIARANPGFLREHKSFSAIQLLSPWQLKQLTDQAGLAMLHQIPERRDEEDLGPIWRRLARMVECGPLSWMPIQEFGVILVAKENQSRLALKKRKHWLYQQAQPQRQPLEEFKPHIDFSESPFHIQLGPGWNWMEDLVHSAYRWTDRRATAYLQSNRPAAEIRIQGFCDPALYPSASNHLEVRVDGWKVGETRLTAHGPFDLIYLVPFEPAGPHLYVVELSSQPAKSPDSRDLRGLGVPITRIELLTGEAV